MTHYFRALSLGLGVLALSACVSPEAHRRVLAANEKLQGQIASLAVYQEELEKENERLDLKVDELGKNAVEADWVLKRKAELADLIREFQTGGTKAVPGVKVLQTPLGVAFQMQGEVLFHSGQVKLTTAGQQLLSQLLVPLRQHDQAIRVDGHTDRDPIRHSQWKTNLRLSSERAMAVIDFLAKKGIEGNRMHAAAFGPHRPAVAGDDDEAKRQNRRVEILMLR